MAQINLVTELNKLQGATAIIENDDTATHAIAAGQYVIWKGNLYIASTAISTNTTLAVGTNLIATNNGGMNQIVYTSTTVAPSNPVKGMIWLKKK